MVPTVFVIDDDVSVLRGLTRLLKSAGYAVQSFGSADAFLASPHQGLAGCILTDLHMPGVNGLELQQKLAENGVSLPMIFFSGDPDVPATVRALKGGALDFLTKPIEERALFDAIDAAFAKDARCREEAAERESIRARFARLTPREHEVCLLVARGLPNKQIAFELGTVEKTIKVHRARVIEKLEVESMADLVRLVDRLRTSPSALNS